MVDQIKTISEDLVQLSRLALTSRSQDVREFIARLGRRYRKFSPRTAEQLTKLVSDNPTPRSPVRNAEVAVLPVDTDTRLELLRFDSAPGVDHRPVWSAEVAARLGEIVVEHQRANDLVTAGLWPTRTAVFTGPPGVGKTLAARWLAAELGIPLLTLDLSAVISSFLGRTGTNLRHVLDYAKGVTCVLLLDEIDAIAKRRDDAHEVGELKRLVTVLLQEIDDWPAGGLLVAATNHPDLLDPAVWRRFESHIEFPLPDARAAQQLLETLLEGAPLNDAWLAVLGRLFAGRSFSDTERELTSARKAAVLGGRPLEDGMTELIKKNCQAMHKSELKSLAIDLLALDVSARQVSELTGLSRDTIRRAQSTPPTEGPDDE
jgi:AAA+ superfamily predicted ATPase